MCFKEIIDNHVLIQKKINLPSATLNHSYSHLAVPHFWLGFAQVINVALELAHDLGVYLVTALQLGTFEFLLLLSNTPSRVQQCEGLQHLCQAIAVPAGEQRGGQSLVMPGPGSR